MIIIEALGYEPHPSVKAWKTKEFGMSMSKNMGLIQVEESHHGYLTEMLTGDEFSERIFGNLDVSVKSVLSTIPEPEKSRGRGHWWSKSGGVAVFMVYCTA